jgi:M6 family metalloprotease-like protein
MSAVQAAPLPADFYPHPCFVPAVPQKQGLRPRLIPPTTRGQTPPVTFGGPAFGYHDWHLKNESAPGDLSAQTAPRDTLHMIALLVDFDDQPMGTVEHGAPADSLDAYFNRVLTFLNQYYQEVSDTLVTVTWELSPRVYRLPETMAWYGDDEDLAVREASLVRDAVQAADNDIDFSRYNRFAVFHAGAGQEADVNNDSLHEIWSVFFRAIDFQYYLDLPPDCIPNEYSETCTGVPTNDTDPATGGKFYVPSMVIYPETESQDGYEFGMLGVIAHEFGHSFGLPDLYDTTGPDNSIYADSQGIGAFGLMGAGIWNENGFFPSEMDAWCKFYSGWLRPEVVRPDPSHSTFNMSLAGIETRGNRRTAAVRIPMGGDEYLLIENRRHDYNNNGRFDFDDPDSNGTFDFWTDSYDSTEFDWYLPRTTSEYPPEQDGSGLLIYHIDESIIRDLIDYNLVNADALHKGVDLEEADGIQDLDKLILTFEAFGDAKDSWWAPFATQFTPHTEPNTDGYGNAHTGIWITDISGPAPEMTFKVGFQDPTAAEKGDLRAGWPQDLPGLTRNLQPIAGDLDGDGIEEIVATSALSNAGRVSVLRADGTPFFTTTGPAELGWSNLRAEPILVNLDDDPRPELVWVSGDSVLATTYNGSFLDNQGTPRSNPVPYFLLPKDPGRIGIAGGNLEPANRNLLCGSSADVLLDGRPEIIVPVADTAQHSCSLFAIASPLLPGLTTTARIVVTDMPGDSVLAPALANVDSFDAGILEIATSVRTATGGYLALTLFDRLNDSCDFGDERTVAFSQGDTIAFSAPVAGDLNRDGLDEIVVLDSQGFVHAFWIRVVSVDGSTKETGPVDPSNVRGSVNFDNALFQEMPGWPVQVGALADDAISLSDIDGDGYLEVLVFGPENKLYVLNYNGTSVLTLPVAVPAENRYTQPFLSPLSLDLDGQAGAELLLPLPDGQVRGHDARGRSLAEWSYLGGGNGRTYPVVTDLDHDGTLELVTVEDVTVSVPDDGTITNGDQSSTLERRGRAVVREVGASGTASGPWPVYRHDLGRTARATTPTATPQDPKTLLMEAFVVPNPVMREDAGFHYQIRSTVNRVTIQVVDTRGQRVRTLEGTIFPGTDNMVRWSLTNENGTAVAPGMYFARFEAESGGSREVHVQPFVVVR